MEFGKVADAKGIDFRLPADHESVARILAASAASTAQAGGPRVFAGCPVWQDDALARKVCPPGTPKSKRLSAYARQFETAELNSTGYALNPGQAREWAAAVPLGFRFCPKIPRDVSLARDLDAVHAAFARACIDLAAFGDRLGAVLLQFPEGFGPSRFGELERLLAVERPAFPLAVEVRHAAWFRNPDWTDRLSSLLEKNKAAMVITDSPGRRDVIHMRLTAPWVYVRWNGHDGGDADLRRLDDWADRIGAWMGRGLREAWFFPQLDPVDQTADLAVHFLRGLKARTGLDLRIPRLYSDEEEPRLAL
jgi:uncharacterized protein YecE (DUF72 family)